MADPSSAVAAIANISIKIFQFSYEVAAVDDKAKDLLETTNAITKTLDSARLLYHQKSHLFNEIEGSWITDVAFKEAERALKKVMGLIEAARVDIDSTRKPERLDKFGNIKPGKVKLGTRFKYVIQESPHLLESLTSLNLAGQLLTQAMGIVCGRGGEVPKVIMDSTGRNAGVPRKPPPTYAESEFLNHCRRGQSRTSLAPSNSSGPPILSNNLAAASVSSFMSSSEGQSSPPLEQYPPMNQGRFAQSSPNLRLSKTPSPTVVISTRPQPRCTGSQSSITSHIERVELPG